MTARWQDHDGFRRFYEWCVYSERLSPATARNTCSYAWAFKKWIEEDRGIYDVNAVTTSHVIQFLDEYGRKPARNRKRPPHPNSVRRVHFFLKRWMRWMHVSGYRATDLLATYHGPRSVTVYVEPPTDGIVRQILETAGQVSSNNILAARDHAIVYWLAFTGVRASELCGVTYQQVCIDGEIPSTLIVTGKGGKQRQIGIPKAVRDATQRWFDVRVDTVDALFINQNFQPITPATLGAFMQRLRRSLGLSRLGPHDLRRWFFNRLVREGVDINEIKSLGGWSTWQAAQHYIHFGTEAVAAQRHSELDIVV